MFSEMLFFLTLIIIHECFLNSDNIVILVPGGIIMKVDDTFYCERLDQQ